MQRNNKHKKRPVREKREHDVQKASDNPRGIVIEALPNTMFRVKLDEPYTYEKGDTIEEVIAYLAGKMKYHRVKVIVGDSVELLMDPYQGKARVVRRH